MFIDYFLFIKCMKIVCKLKEEILLYSPLETYKKVQGYTFETLDSKSNYPTFIRLIREIFFDYFEVRITDTKIALGYVHRNLNSFYYFKLHH